MLVDRAAPDWKFGLRSSDCSTFLSKLPNILTIWRTSVGKAPLLPAVYATSMLLATGDLGAVLAAPCLNGGIGVLPWKGNARMVRRGAQGCRRQMPPQLVGPGTAVATAAWMDYLERLAERMQLQLMRAELARARSEAQESRRCARDLVIRSRDVSLAIALRQGLSRRDRRLGSFCCHAEWLSVGPDLAAPL